MLTVQTNWAPIIWYMLHNNNKGAEKLHGSKVLLKLRQWCQTATSLECDGHGIQRVHATTFSSGN